MTLRSDMFEIIKKYTLHILKPKLGKIISDNIAGSNIMTISWTLKAEKNLKNRPQLFFKIEHKLWVNFNFMKEAFAFSSLKWTLN
jgi:DNA replication initiation complex subunit (GINS family)